MLRCIPLILLFGILIVRPADAQTDLMISGAEAYLDADPGPGLGTPLPTVDGSYDGVLEPLLGGPVPIPVLEGMHVLWMRAQDGNQVWGPAFGVVMNIDTTMLETSVAERSRATRMHIVPNVVPLGGSAEVHLPAGHSEGRIVLQDELGRCVREVHTNGALHITLDLDKFATGTYLVHAFMGPLTYAAPLVVVR